MKLQKRYGPDLYWWTQTQSHRDLIAYYRQHLMPSRLYKDMIHAMTEVEMAIKELHFETTMHENGDYSESISNESLKNALNKLYDATVKMNKMHHSDIHREYKKLERAAFREPTF